MTVQSVEMLIEFVAAPAWQVVLIADVIVGGSGWLLSWGMESGPVMRRWIVPTAVVAVSVAAAEFHGKGFRDGLWILIVVVLGVDAFMVGGRTSMRGYRAAAEEFGERSPQVYRAANWLCLRIVVAMVGLATLSSFVIK